MRGLRVTTGPAVEPVTLAQAKLQCRVDSSAEDELFQDQLMPAAREWVERKIGRTLISTEYRLTLDAFPAGCIRLPNPPLLYTEAADFVIEYDDASGDEQTLSASLYRLNTDVEPGLVEPAYSEVWPTTIAQTGAVRITFKGGYGESADTVPNGIKQAVLVVVNDWYENRDNRELGKVADPTMTAVDRLLLPYWTGEYV